MKALMVAYLIGLSAPALAQDTPFCNDLAAIAASTTDARINGVTEAQLMRAAAQSFKNDRRVEMMDFIHNVYTRPEYRGRTPNEVRLYVRAMCEIKIRQR